MEIREVNEEKQEPADGEQKHQNKNPLQEEQKIALIDHECECTRSWEIKKAALFRQLFLSIQILISECNSL